ncbi:BNR-4 repeat-containing protein [Micromonospora sp. NPDC049799]|uniref:BNR-4 repeat-containing protein n=1 Tax=Micromonospora sp. NPDC049799 TaxID=3154741 RepID=UPI0033C52AC1
MRRLLTGVLVVLTAVALHPGPALAAPAAVTLVPYPIDSSNQAAWWTPVETYVGAQQYTYFAFNEPGTTAGTHRVAIGRRDGSGSWTRLPLMNGSTRAEYADDIGHNQPSMARDGSGRFHVFASMHNDTWRYFRSDSPGGVPQNRSGEMPDQGIGVTYPVLTSAPNGDVYLFARLDGSSSGGRTGRLYRWNDAASTWSRVAVVAASANRAVYPDDLRFDSAGDLHLLWEWSLYPSAAFRHQLSYLKYRPGSGTFVDRTGATRTVPVSTSTADVVQPVEAGEVYEGNESTGPAVQSAKLTLDGTSPKITYRYRSLASGPVFTVRYAYVGGSGAWTRQTVWAAEQTRAALGITWHPTEGKRIYFARTAGADRVLVATEDGGTWTTAPVAPGLPIDRLAVEPNAAGTDVLYLADTTNGRLYHGRD